MNASYRHFGAGLVLLSLLAGVSCQEEYLPIEAAIEIPEAPKETLCSVKVYQISSLCLMCIKGARYCCAHADS